MPIRIASPDNSRIKLIRRLSTRKGRYSEKRFVAEGLNLVSEAVRLGMDIDFILTSEEYECSLVSEIERSGRIPVYTVPAGVFGRITDAGPGLGLLAVIRMREYDISYINELEPSANVLVLDRIQDPGNIGTMIRTAAASGYGMIIACKGTADVWSPKVLRATAGMIFDIPFAYADDAAGAVDEIRRSGRRIVVTDPAGGRPYYEEDLSSGVALVIGNEGNGISDEVMALADIRVTLPMMRGVESLNAAVSAAILMYEAVRK